MTPEYPKHDCTRCTHLGTVRMRGEIQDLYAHTKENGEIILVARFGPDSKDYVGMARTAVSLEVHVRGMERAAVPAGLVLADAILKEVES